MTARTAEYIDASDFERAADALERAGFDRVAGGHAAKAVRASINAARKGIRGRARRHRRTGKMASRIRTRFDGRGFAIVGQVRAGGAVAHLIAGGTAPHAIEPIQGRVLALAGRGGGIVGYARHVEHPGTAADPFVALGIADARPAMETAWQDAGEAMVAELAERMTKR